MLDCVLVQLSQIISAYSKSGRIKDLYMISSAFLPSLYLKCRKQLMSTFTLLEMLLICSPHLQLF